MEDDSLQHQHLGSVNFPVKGMESVLATVSGYHGAERFNLIRLISRSGASYIGNMNQCVTHLVCWKFEGKKYELAKKFKIAIVNHRWIEECVKKGRRVSEEPYMFQSGEEMGPVFVDIPLGIDQGKAQFKQLKKSKRPVIDIESDDANDAAWTKSIFLDEHLFPETDQNIHCSNRSARKVIKRNSRKGPSSIGYSIENPSWPTNLEGKEVSTSRPADSCKMKSKGSTSSEPRCKGRRLVKKQLSMKDWLITPNMEEDCKEVKVLPRNNRSRILSDSSDIEGQQGTSTRHASDIRCFLSGQDTSDAWDDIHRVNDENQNAHVNGAPSSHPASSEEVGEACGDLIDIDPGERLPASSEMSCVICWTDFSSTRGVLPCGHRFCFSCIQNWADHMASRRKASTCPLCKASFICITKVEDAVSADQKIYSQSIPHDSLNMDLYILPDETHRPGNPSAAVCCRCSSREPEDLLIRCHFCEIRCVHSYCLDPPLFPWTCIQCKDLQMLYLHTRSLTFVVVVMLSCARISLSILNIVILFYAVDQIIDAKYLSHHASQRVCSSDNASSLLWTGVLFLITTMIGIMGYCCGMRGLQYIYLWILIIWTISTVVLFIFIMATLPKTTAGDAYMQTAAKGVWLNQYKPALQRALVNDKDWHRVTACYMEINICNLIKNTTDEYVFRYVDVGCCKAPNRCRVLSNKVLSPLESPEMDSECKMWSRMGDQCFECDSCKAAYIANYQEEWESHVPSQIARILLLVGMAALAFFAFDDDDHDHRRDANDQKHGKRVRV